MHSSTAGVCAIICVALVFANQQAFGTTCAAVAQAVGGAASFRERNIAQQAGAQGVQERNRLYSGAFFSYGSTISAINGAAGPVAAGALTVMSSRLVNTGVLGIDDNGIVHALGPILVQAKMYWDLIFGGSGYAFPLGPSSLMELLRNFGLGTESIRRNLALELIVMAMCTSPCGDGVPSKF